MLNINSDATLLRREVTNRRDFLASSACLLTFTLGGCEKKITPTQARASGVPFRTLDAGSVAVLDGLGEILLPGSASAGLSHYIDHQLSGDAADSMLMIKYLGVAAPFTQFYEGGLHATNALARAVHGKDFSSLSQAQAAALVTKMSGGQVEGWQGPPAGLFYFVLRSDAVDVMYGTKSGFEQLGVPYMAHIEPPSGGANDFGGSTPRSCRRHRGRLRRSRQQHGRTTR